MAIKIVTDSTAYIEEEIIKDRDIEVVPLSYELDDEQFIEGFPGTYDDYFLKLSRSKNFAKTSQPAVGDFLEVFKKALNSNDEVIAILMSSKLSGTYNSALMAANMLETDKITVIDSLTTVAHLKTMVLTAKDMANQGYCREDIVHKVYDIKNHMGISVTVGSLEYLKRGGRLSVTKAALGKILNIKPVIKLEDGRLLLKKSLRGKSRALKYMIEQIPKDVCKICICHVMCKDRIMEIKDILKNKFPNVEIDIDEIGPIIGSHLGPDSFGFCYTWR